MSSVDVESPELWFDRDDLAEVIPLERLQLTANLLLRQFGSPVDVPIHLWGGAIPAEADLENPTHAHFLTTPRLQNPLNSLSDELQITQALRFESGLWKPAQFPGGFFVAYVDAFSSVTKYFEFTSDPDSFDNLGHYIEEDEIDPLQYQLGAAFGQLAQFGAWDPIVEPDNYPCVVDSAGRTFFDVSLGTSGVTRS